MMTERAVAQASWDRVLICDDETRLATLTADLLEDRGFSLAICEDARQALGAVLDPGGNVGVLLLDVNLNGGMTAGQLLAALGERGMTPRVVLTSGLAREDVAPELLGHPLVVGYLPKPYSIEALIAVVESAAESPAAG